MFNKLIVSTTNRRKQRTAKFFCGTAVFYLLSVAAAFAVSIIIENPKLADTSAHSTLMMVPALPEAPSGPVKPVASRPSLQAATQNDPTHVSDLDYLIANTSSATKPSAMPNGPPQLGKFDGDPAFGGGEYIPGAGGPGLPGGREHGEAAAPPKPPDPPKPPAQVEPKDNRPVRLTSSVLQGKAIVRRTPDYPKLAVQVRLGGSVMVEVIISPDGRVESARAVSGHALLKSTAEDAARGWRFEPTLLNGTAVRVTGVIVFNFKMNE